MEPERSNFPDTRVYWIQIAISVFFGLSTYYLASYLPYFDFGSGLWGITGNFILISLIYIILLVALPFLLLQLKTEKTILQSLILSARGIIAQLPIFVFLLTINYVLNMRV